MALTTRQTYWKNSEITDVICPNCNSSCIDNGSIWPRKCWCCNVKLPRMYKYFLKRKTARYLYHIGSNAVNKT